MKKKLGNVFCTVAVSCAFSLISVLGARADVVTVSSLPGTAAAAVRTAETGTAVTNRTSVNVVEATSSSPDISGYSSNIASAGSSAIISSTSAATSVNYVDNTNSTGDSNSNTSGADNIGKTSNTSNTHTASTPIVTASTSLADSEKKYGTAAGAASSSAASAAASAPVKTVPVINAVTALDDPSGSYSETTTSQSSSSYTQVTKQASVVEAIGGADDKDAQQATTSEVGFCVVLGSSPTGTMRDITG